MPKKKKIVASEKLSDAPVKGTRKKASEKTEDRLKPKKKKVVASEKLSDAIVKGTREKKVSEKAEDSLMPKKKKIAASEKLSDAIVKGMQEKKASEIVVMDLRKVKNAVADFFVICSGNSDKQLEAISDSIDEQVYKLMQEKPWHMEGKNNKEWMILDYISVVSHVFRKDRRQFYSLEKLWGDAEITEIED